MAAGDPAAYVTINVGANPTETGEAVAYVTFNVGANPTGTGEAVAYVTFNAAFPAPVQKGEANAYATIHADLPPPGDPLVTPVPGDYIDAPTVDLAAWPDPLTVTAVIPVSTGERSDSAALLSDGRVLYVFVDGGSIKQGYAPSLNAFLTIDGSVTDITTLVTNLSGPNCCVFTDPAGDLFLITSSNPDATAGRDPDWRGNRCWVSPSGLGGDWINRGTIQLPGGGVSSWINMGTETKSVGHPHFAADGSWVVTIPHYLDYNDGNDTIRYKHAAVYRSTNRGYTWTELIRSGHGIVGGPYGIGMSRNIGGLDGWLYVLSTGQGASESNSKLFASDDDGATWVNTVVLGVNTFGSFPLQGDGYLYRFGPNGDITRSAAPGPGTDGFTSWRDYTFMSSQNGAVVQPLGTSFAYMHDGKVLGLRSSAWTVGYIGFG